MSNISPIAYASPIVGKCLLCHDRPVVASKKIYQNPVCKKCYYRFVNRRQLAYVVDAVLLLIVAFGILLPLGDLFAPLPQGSQMLVDFSFGLVFGTLFSLKDGFNGQSPGKRLMGVQVVDVQSGAPISFGQSFKRNLILQTGVIPMVGGLVSLAVVIIIIIQMGKGPRLGDRWAKTRVIWKRFSRTPVFADDLLACESCGYDLTGNVSGTCPECGTTVSDSNHRRLVTAAPASGVLVN